MSTYIEVLHSHSWDAVAEARKCSQIEDFFSLIRTGKIQELKAHIRKHPEAVLYTNNLRENALHIAVKAQQPEILKVILDSLPENISKEDKDRFINQRNSEGFSALMVCAVQKSTDCARLLMPHHPNLLIEGYDIQRNVMHLAAECNADEILRMVLSEKDENGKPILNPNQVCANSFKKFGYAPLHLAASSRAEKSAAVLIELGADINMPATANHQSLGKTPLMIALEAKSFDIVKLFLKNEKIDLTRKDIHGNVAYHYAKRHTFMLDFIEALKVNLLDHTKINSVSKHDDKKHIDTQHTVV